MQVTRSLVIAACVLACLPAAAPAGDVYRWVDENGQVVFGGQRPPGVEVQRVEVRHSRSAPDTASDELQRLLDEAGLTEAQLEAKREAERRRAAREAARQKVYAQNCRMARTALQNLESGGQYLIRTADGKVVHADDDLRARRTARAREQVEEFCR